MDKGIITRELQILLEAINEQFEIIREYEDFIPQIEFDMIMENVRKLYETFHRLQRLNDPLLFVEKKISGPQDLKKPVSKAPPPAAKLVELPSEPRELITRLPDPEPVAADEPIAETVPDTVAETPPPTVTETFPEPPPVLPIRPIVKKESPKRQAKTAELDLFAAGEPVFSIKLKEAREKSLGPKISRHDSFKAAIGINDKFMFINELFDGNLRDYNEAIETLGGFKTLPQAQEYLDLLRRRFNWNSASNGFKRIKELVENRY